ncbi:MAG: hypothetical protein FWD15_01310 [Alphaproteobacteria bacterium]|nr:hypothetical protein [Alphaproteobacteria bacterium]
MQYNQLDKYSARLNLSSPREPDALDLAFMCKEAIARGFGYITVPRTRLDDAFKWTKNTSITRVGLIDAATALSLPEIIFREIKDAVARGAGMVEVALPAGFFCVNYDNIPAVIDEYLLAAIEASGNGKTPLKIALETAVLPGAADIKRAVHLLSGYNIKCIKTASGFNVKNSTLAHLNAVLEEARFAEKQVDFCFDSNSGEFIVDEAFRLFGKIIKTPINRLVVSVPLAAIRYVAKGE